MSSQGHAPQRLLQARQLVREKGLSKHDLSLLEEILRAGASDLAPLAEVPTLLDPGAEPESVSDLRRHLGLFLAFLATFSAKRLGEARGAMGLVIQSSLTRLNELAQTAHKDVLSESDAPEWVVMLLDLLASLRAMSLAPTAEAEATLREHWSAFVGDHREQFRLVLGALQRSEDGPARVAKLNAQMKSLNRAYQNPNGRPQEALRKLAEHLEAAIPSETHERVEPFLLVEHVISNLRLSLIRPLDRGIHWPAVEQVRGSLQWLWDHLGWALRRVDGRLLGEALPAEVRKLLQQMRRDHHQAFLVVARALASHLAVFSLLEQMESALSSSLDVRYASVAHFFVVESELGRLAERVYQPSAVESLPPSPEITRLKGFFRQAVLSLRQDQSTLRSLLQQALANEDADQLAQALVNLRELLVGHQKQLMGDLVAVFSPELRSRLFPDSPSLTEEGDRLRQRLQRLFESLTPLQGQLQIHLELNDWPRLALGLAQAQHQVQAFRRSPEFALIRSNDRQEADRLVQQLVRSLEAPLDIESALREGHEILGDLLRFLDLFLLRINARVPLIRHDLEIARDALKITQQLQVQEVEASERTRLSHKLIQTSKRLGVRDPQTVLLLKRWIRAERGQREARAPLDQLASHLERLSTRLEAALD
jgi:hypothetical protein